MPEPTEQPDHITVFEKGPYLQVAAICERVLVEQDGVASIIRMVDRIQFSAAGAPETMPPFSANLTLMVVLKSGMARGPVPVRISIEAPSGIANDGGLMTAFLEGEDRGVNLITQMSIQFTEQGLYWFAIYVENKLMTKVPFRLIYARTTGPLAPR